MRFWGELGSTVYFKRPKRNSVPWKVIKIETDVDKIHWTHGGGTPNYIYLETDAKNVRPGQPTTCWTCENKLRPKGFK